MAVKPPLKHAQASSDPLTAESSGVWSSPASRWHDAMAFAIHDALNHVLALLGSIDFLQHPEVGALAPPDQARELECMTVTCRQLSHLLKEALAAADDHTFEVIGASLQLSQIVDESVARIRAHAHAVRAVNIEVRHDQVSVGLPDGLLIRRVIDNLLHQAIEHSPVCGTVVIQWRMEENAVTIEVSDQGPGISAECCERIFDPPEPGCDDTGAGRRRSLGLPFCRAVARGCGGQVGVRAGDNGGTVILFTIPLPLPD